MSLTAKPWKYTTNREAIMGNTIKELAKKLKISMKDSETDDTIEVKVWNFLGAQGWELVSVSQSGFYVFKRRS